ncbi:MAG: chemotaxis protein CheW [Acidobacteriota bacterium]
MRDANGRRDLNGSAGEPARIAGDGETEEFVSFWVAGQLLGIPVGMVQEVLTSQKIAPVPLAPREVAGLLNLRGQIVTAVDLRARLGLDPLADGEEPMNVVVLDQDELFSLLVDEVGDVITVDRNLFEAPPSTLEERWRRVCSGVYRLERRLLVVIDVGALLARQATAP